MKAEQLLQISVAATVAMGSLLLGMSQQNVWIPALASLSLAGCGSGEAQTDGPTDDIKMNAVKALGNIRVGGADALMSVLTGDGSDELKAAAANSMGSVLSLVDGSEEQIAALMEAAKGEGDVAKAAFQALGRVRNLTPQQKLDVFRTHRLQVPTKGN